MTSCQWSLISNAFWSSSSWRFWRRAASVRSCSTYRRHNLPWKQLAIDTIYNNALTKSAMRLSYIPTYANISQIKLWVTTVRYMYWDVVSMFKSHGTKRAWPTSATMPSGPEGLFLRASPQFLPPYLKKGQVEAVPNSMSLALNTVKQIYETSQAIRF